MIMRADREQLQGGVDEVGIDHEQQAGDQLRPALGLLAVGEEGESDQTDDQLDEEVWTDRSRSSETARRPATVARVARRPDSSRGPVWHGLRRAGALRQALEVLVD